MTQISDMTPYSYSPFLLTILEDFPKNPPSPKNIDIV